MNIENQLRIGGRLQERGGRLIQLTQTNYEASHHELCLSLAEQLWGPEGLIQSLGPAWFMVLDPRFAACERVWTKKRKVTGSEEGFEEVGVITIDDLGNVGTSRMISLEQYSEMLGEGRYFSGVVQDAHEVKTWAEGDLFALVQRHCPNYFSKDGVPNELARILVKMFQEDLLGLILDYAPVSNLNQWVTVESGQLVHDHTRVDPSRPVAHAEIEYLDRALSSRAVLRANTVKVLAKLGGEELASAFDKVQLTEAEKDRIIRMVFQYPYDELYKALPDVLGVLEKAQGEGREEQQLKGFQAMAQAWAQELKSGKRQPYTLTSEDFSEEAALFQSLKGDPSLVAIFYMLVEAESMVEAYPHFQKILDRLHPLLEKAEPLKDEEFSALCEWVSEEANAALPGTVGESV